MVQRDEPSLPFLRQFWPLIRTGRKNATARIKPYGSVGHVIQGPDGMKLRIIERKRLPLGVIAQFHWYDEGVDSPEEFVKVWKKIHTRQPYDPNRLVYFHRFRLVEG